MKIDALLETYQVDKAHARHVADLALALYDAACEPCSLPASGRRLLEMSALLHNVGLTTDPAQHHLVGRDIVLRHSIEGLSAKERAIVAAAVAFHRKRVRPEQEPAFLALGRKNRSLALKVAAVLRVADGLDYSQSQTTQIATSVPDEAGLLVQIGGPHSTSDGERAAAKADLWKDVLPRPLVVRSDPDSATVAANGNGTAPAPIKPVALAPQPSLADADAVEAEAASLAPWYADAGVSLAELCRVLLRRHFRRMLAAERQARAGDDHEAVHELRVATRRLRATLSVAAAVAPERTIRKFRKATQQVAQAAGAVRDCDVFLLHIEAAQAALPAEQRPELEPLLDALRADRVTALEKMVAAYHGDEHRAFKRDFAAFIASAASWDEQPLVRDLAGSMIYRQYEALRACAGGAQLGEALLADVEGLHDVRIEAKRLRYLIEAFADVFGERVDEALKPLVSVQDSMGQLNDIAIAGQYIDRLPPAVAEQPALVAYLATREAARANLLAELARRWEKLTSATYRRTLMGLIVKL